MRSLALVETKLLLDLPSMASKPHKGNLDVASIENVAAKFQVNNSTNVNTTKASNQTTVSTLIGSTSHSILLQENNILNSSNASMGGCLLVMDDNYLLSEWIAYHYTVLPLRYLVVMPDPKSRQSPKEILQQWEETDLKYWVWDPFIPRLPPGKNASYGAWAVEAHRRRQKKFITQCSSFLRKIPEVHWVPLIDSDEYLALNPYSEAEFQEKTVQKDIQKKPAIKTKYDARKSLTESTKFLTILDMINVVKNDVDLRICMALDRLFFGAVPRCNASCPQQDSPLPESIVSQQLRTFRFVHHEEQHDCRKNGNGKVLVDLSSPDNSSFVKQGAKNPHRPWKECPDPYSGGRYELFHVHHYLGSEEEYLSRVRDERRSVEAFRTKGNIDKGSKFCNIQSWLDQFVKVIGGTHRAQALLNLNVSSPMMSLTAS